MQDQGLIEYVLSKLKKQNERLPSQIEYKTQSDAHPERPRRIHRVLSL